MNASCNYRAYISWTNGQQTTFGLVARSTQDTFRTIRDMFKDAEIESVYAAPTEALKQAEALNQAKMVDDFDRYINSNNEMYLDNDYGGYEIDHTCGGDIGYDYDVEFPPIFEKPSQRHINKNKLYIIY